jgi:hypothetical protein
MLRTWHSNEEHNQLVPKILAACRRPGIICGLPCRNVRITTLWEAEGVPLLDSHSDLHLLREGAAAVLAGLRGDRL